MGGRLDTRLNCIFRSLVHLRNASTNGAGRFFVSLSDRCYLSCVTADTGRS